MFVLALWLFLGGIEGIAILSVPSLRDNTFVIFDELYFGLHHPPFECVLTLGKDWNLGCPVICANSCPFSTEVVMMAGPYSNAPRTLGEQQHPAPLRRQVWPRRLNCQLRVNATGHGTMFVALEGYLRINVFPVEMIFALRQQLEFLLAR